MKYLLTLSLLLLAVPAFAQEPTPTPPAQPTEMPVTVVPQNPDPLEPAIGPEAFNPQPQQGSGAEMVDLNFPDAQITDILLNYERLSGKRLIKDANLAGQNISIVVAGKVPKSEAISIIEATLLLNNYALVPYGENQVKILNITTGKSPRSEGLRVYASPASLPAGDEIITYYMGFKYLDSQEALQTMQAQATGSHPYAIYLRVPSTQALLITENTSVIRQLLEIKELIDVPPAKIVSEFVPLMRADAERVAETITKLIEAQKSAAGSATGHPAPGAPPLPQNPDGSAATANVPNTGSDSSPSSLFAGQVQLVPDTRTNRILLIARPSSFPYIKGLIQEFDQAIGLTDPLEMPLKYVSAGEILPVLADLLAEDTKDANGGTGGVQTPSTNKTRSQGLGSGSGNGGTLGGSGTSSAAQLGDLEGPNQDTGPESKIVGKTRIIADKKSNSILVFGPPESIAKCKVIIGRLDKKPQQVYLSTVIGQLKLTENQEFGVDFLQPLVGNDSGIAGSSITRSAGSVINPADLNVLKNFPAVAGLNLYGTIGDSLSYYVRALEATNRFKVLSRPVIYTANNKTAVISSGQSIAVPTETLTDSNLNNNGTASVRSNIGREEVLLRLEVIPLINSDNEVTLQVKQTNDSIIGNQTVSGELVPTIGRQGITTTVTVANRHVVVLGGLITENKTNDKTSIPVLGSIPLLGNLFRSNKDTTERNELLIFIQPNVVNNNQDAYRESGVEEARTEIAPQARELSNIPTNLPGPAPKTKPFRK